MRQSMHPISTIGPKNLGLAGNADTCAVGNEDLTSVYWYIVILLSSLVLMNDNSVAVTQFIPQMFCTPTSATKR